MAARERRNQMSHPRGVSGSRRGLPVFMVFMALVAMLSGCTSDESRTPFRLLSSSENRALEPLIQEFAKCDESKIEVTYMGSVDIMRELANGADSTFDAV